RSSSSCHHLLVGVAGSRLRNGRPTRTSLGVAAGYQLALRMPGSSPRCASSRRQIRQSRNLRYTDLARPQRLQRVYPRTANFGLRFALTIIDFLAMASLVLSGTRAGGSGGGRLLGEGES